eukprot:TRINITY_DN29371_c0_g2_i3.p1 TRINITY_DN29371_c0_g2~~TRINITY_DN29371_c0_g2_i3.p1  ORF type:complete len:535 (+),score=104.38 TRINITY_DN29371_c0_g2_i3:188-1792(+)
MLVVLVVLCCLGSAAAGSVNLGGRDKENGPDLEGGGFHSLQDFHDGLGMGQVPGYVVALGDLNSDKYNDLFVVNPNRTEVGVYVWSRDDWKFSLLGSPVVEPCAGITHVIPADFNHDGRLDVVIGGVDQDGKSYNHVHLNEESTLGDSYKAIGFNLKNGTTPTFLDVDDDMQLDMIGVTPTLPRAVWLNHMRLNGSFSEAKSWFSGTTTISLSHCDDHLQACYSVSSSPPLANPLSVAMSDMDGDCSADILMIVDVSNCANGTQRALEVWVRESGELELDRVYSLPDGSSQLMTQDLDRDGDLDVTIVAGDTVYFMYNSQKSMCSSQWELESSSCRPQQQLCTRDPEFSLQATGCTPASLSVPTVSGVDGAMLTGYEPFTSTALLRFGDYDLDGYPDVLAGITSPGGESSVQLWRNSHSNGRTFTRMDSRVAAATKSTGTSFCGAFMDLNDDLSTDILVMANSSEGVPSVGFLYNNEDYDAFAVKVLGGNGVCPEWCHGDDKFPDPKPYGVNFAGNTFKAVSYTHLTLPTKRIV